MNRKITSVTKKGGGISPQTIVWVIFGLVVMVAAGVYLYRTGWTKPTYTPSNTELVYTRDIAKDDGRNLEPRALVDKKTGTPLNSIWTKANLKRFGADGALPDGDGVSIKFRVTVNGRPLPQFDQDCALPPLGAIDARTDYPARQRQAEEKKAECERAAASFAGELQFDRLTVIVLDTTGGVTTDLAHRVRETVKEACAQGGQAHFYRLTGDWYQGGRLKLNCSDKNEAAIDAWLAEKDKPNSAVLAPLKAIFGEIADEIGEHPDTVVRAFVFTDGLENSGGINLYDRNQLREENWATLDKVFGIDDLSLAGVIVHLRPIPQPNGEDKAKMDIAHAYLADRLRGRNAAVTIDDF